MTSLRDHLSTRPGETGAKEGESAPQHNDSHEDDRHNQLADTVACLTALPHQTQSQEKGGSRMCTLIIQFFFSSAASCRRPDLCVP